MPGQHKDWKGFAMTVEQFITNVNELKKYLVDDFNKDIMIVVSNDMVSGIKERVQKTGMLHDGTIRQYSRHGFLFRADQFLQKSAIPKSKGGGVPVEVFLKGGYEEFRRIQGLQTEHKDYNYTGDMWRNTGVLKEKTDSKFVYIGGKTPMAQNLINKNSQRDKEPIIMPSPKEIEDRADMVGELLSMKINDILNV